MVRIEVSSSGVPAVLVGRQLQAMPDETPGRFFIETALDVKPLEAGTYVLKASLLDGDTDLGGISRPIRIAAR